VLPRPIVNRRAVALRRSKFSETFFSLGHQRSKQSSRYRQLASTDFPTQDHR
jgi:hypothetical protein